MRHFRNACIFIVLITSFTLLGFFIEEQFEIHVYLSLGWIAKSLYESLKQTEP